MVRTVSRMSIDECQTEYRMSIDVCQTENRMSTGQCQTEYRMSTAECLTVTKSSPENVRINKTVYTSTIQTAADSLCLQTANLNSPNVTTAAANRSHKRSSPFNPTPSQAALTKCPLNLCMLQHTYRSGTAVPLWRQVAGSGWSSSCGLQLALTEPAGSVSQYIALGCGPWADTE